MINVDIKLTLLFASNAAAAL